MLIGIDKIPINEQKLHSAFCAMEGKTMLIKNLSYAGFIRQLGLADTLDNFMAFYRACNGPELSPIDVQNAKYTYKTDRFCNPLRCDIEVRR